LAGAPKKRGPARRGVDPRDKKLAEQAREISRWQKRAERAEALVALQKQVAALLGTPLADETSRWRRSPRSDRGWASPPRARPSGCRARRTTAGAGPRGPWARRNARP